MTGVGRWMWGDGCVVTGVWDDGCVVTGVGRVRRRGGRVWRRATGLPC